MRFMKIEDGVAFKFLKNVVTREASKHKGVPRVRIARKKLLEVTFQKKKCMWVLGARSDSWDRQKEN